MLGSAQKEAFKATLRPPDATWKVVINEVNITEAFGLPYDRWEGYAAERKEILDFIRDEGIENVVFVTGDLHASFVADASSRSSSSSRPR